MAEEFKDRGLEVLAINVTRDSRERIERFAYDQDLSQRFILNGRRLAEHYRVRATPTTIYLDTQGHVVDQHTGARPIAEMRRKIEAILPES